MTRPRSALVSLEATPYYHCIARCVRRAFLCGDDRYTGRNFDHRKPWLTERMALLAEIFAIDIAAYAVMSNHYHVVLHVDAGRSLHWSTDEVVARWMRLYRGPDVIRQYQAHESLSKPELALVEEIANLWRERLCSISWFMRCLNEYLARRANAEDGCKGRFWEARFKSQALLDESALLSCMAYVDLNPVRAGVARNLEESNYTSVQNRIAAVKSRKSAREKGGKSGSSLPRLMPFSVSIKLERTLSTIPFRLRDYLELVDWTGRAIRQDKRGFIGKSEPKLLAALGLTFAEWKVLALEVQKQSITMLHGLDELAVLKRKSLKNAA